MSATHLNCFCIGQGERFVFAGDKSGRVHTLDVDTLASLGAVQAHLGTVQVLIAREGSDLFASLGKDHTVAVWRHDGAGRPTRVFARSTRRLSADDIEPVHSESQALAVHATRPRVATRTGNGCVVELDFTDPADVAIRFVTRAFPDTDLISLRYHGDQLLAGDINGSAALLDDGVVRKRFLLNDSQETVHWFEPLGGARFLYATDARFVGELDVETGASRRGPVFARDDMEHVARDPVSGRVFASSFERRLFELDPVTLEARPVYDARFKLRWLRALGTAPGHVIVQVRDGSLVRVDADTGRAVAEHRATPAALWSADTMPGGALLVAGEGDTCVELRPAAPDPLRRTPRFVAHARPLGAADSITKRLVVQRGTGLELYGRTDGKLLAREGAGPATVLVDLGAAVRDLAVADRRPLVYAALEDGRVVIVDVGLRRVVAEHQADQPVWSLALNEAAGLVAAGERLGALSILGAEDLAVHERTRSRFPKRLRWLDERTLLASRSADVDRIVRDPDGGWLHQEGWFTGTGNTIEDFDWDAARRYLVGINYNKRLLLWDLETGELLAHAAHDLDYMKGVRFLDGDATGTGYPADLVVYGRSGTVFGYRVHDEQLHALGVLHAV